MLPSVQPQLMIDPFYLYLDLTEWFSAGQVFLLDAAKETGSAEYCMSLVGVAPMLEIQVKDGDVWLTALPSIIEYLKPRLVEAGNPNAYQVDRPRFESVITGVTLSFESSDVMRLLEAIRVSIRELVNRVGTCVDGPFTSGLLGYIGYDAVHYVERLPKTTVDDRGMPDIRLQWHALVVHLNEGRSTLYSTVDTVSHILDDSERHALSAAAKRVEDVLAAQGLDRESHPALRALESQSSPKDTEVMEDVSQARYEENVRHGVEYIRAGDVFQVVLSKRMRISRTLHPYVAYERLRRLNPSPYMFMVEYPDMRLFGTSPEVQFRAVNGLAEMKPIAGTSKGRGATPDEDDRLRQRLLNDEKERAEHVMLVDLCRNDLGRVCEVGSVSVPEFMVSEPFSHLFHLVSTVRGTLRPEVSVFYALLATFPAGTLSGAPKIRAMEIIDELETLRRGAYGGMIGMIDFEANANTAIVIRTVIDDGEWYYVQAGAGVVADSDPTQEWLECGHKTGALRDVLIPRRT